MSRPNFSRSRSRKPWTRTNERIRAREVRVVDAEGKQLGVFSKRDALSMARARRVDLVEVAAHARPPVCRLVDFGKYRYEEAKKKKESKKNQHSNKVKEVQLSVKINSHDRETKRDRAVDFLCEDMKVKITLRFRGRENAHREIGFQLVNDFVQELSSYGHVDAPPKMIGRGLNCMVSPLPKSQRAPNPRGLLGASDGEDSDELKPEAPEETGDRVAVGSAADSPPEGLQDQAFSELETQLDLESNP